MILHADCEGGGDRGGGWHIREERGDDCQRGGDGSIMACRGWLRYEVNKIPMDWSDEQEN